MLAGEKTFEKQFRSFSSKIQYFRNCLEDAQKIISSLQKAYKDDMNSDVINAFISEQETQKFEEFVSKKAAILVVGQTNSGKSSLINELLGGTYLPTAEIPCTSRIVRICYSDNNYVEVQGPNGECVQGKQSFGKKRIPRDEIALDDDKKRSDAEWVRCVVKVGLNNSLLRGGHLELVDAPGMSENEVLDQIVQECIHGILQVVIYVIDGNSSLRTQDREFLFSLKERIDSIPIFFVCNKVDTNAKAAEFDRDSDDSDDDSSLDNVETKMRQAYKALVGYGLIDSDIQLEDCAAFHGISTHEVRKARHKKIHNQFTDAFEVMKSSFLTFLDNSLNANLGYTTDLLLRILQRIFDFYISRGPLRGDLESICRDIRGIQAVERTYFNKMCEYVKSNHTKLHNVMESSVNSSSENILKEAEEMEFAPIRIGNAVKRNEIINQCRDQIHKLVLLRVLNISLKEATKTLRVIAGQMKRKLDICLENAAKHDNLTNKLVTNQLHICYLNRRDIEEMINMGPIVNFSLMSRTFKTWDQLKRFATDVLSNVTGTEVNKSWKRKIAKNILDNVNFSEVSHRIIEVILTDNQASHETFQINTRCMEQLCKMADKQSDCQQMVVFEHAHSFAEVICRTEALMNTLLHPEVKLLEPLGRPGYRGTVYNCLVPAGRFGKCDVVAKQYKSVVSPNQFLALQQCMRSFDDADQHGILRPSSIVLVDVSILTLLLPACTTDLYTALSGSAYHMPMSVRISLLLQITEACLYCRAKNVHLIDPRLTNVKLDGDYRSMLDISKPRDDSVPYPDGMAPFHVSAPPPPLIAFSTNTTQTAHHDVYALGILGWLLAMEKYIRPQYAQTVDVKEIYEATSRMAHPHFTVEIEANYEVFTGLMLDCFLGTISLWDLSNRLKKAIGAQ
ncbi:dual serine/threonine and tyrosine protein kinase isoform X2 [Nematostella vectensis]|nr:dual serine/threonine and tyrosine protein kinase isoform X2 [Nematostella vectensis]XP_032222786.1 dual serine/threonine and tyrosine protein kinase isoform X2 [Nematostella vectensis]XP_048579601.1 dual serine/threonine and tyrosine protein kinase isoform X2 [Nematostella vectensis]